MVTLAKGNLLRAETEALVNTVNCVGFMGKGVALQFKKAFPDNFAYYQKGCRGGDVQPGRMLIFETGAMLGPKYIINFPTKQHWRGKSKYEYIETGLEALVAEVKSRGIRSIAFPPLGCGLGGLDWKRVRPMIEAALKKVPEVDAILFEPAGAPDAKTMPIGTQRPKMTVARALLIKLMEQYLQLDYRLTLLEIQKLAYFLQESGEPLRLRYEAGIYGPYAPNLNKVLEILEGHFIQGYGDSQKPDVEIELLSDAVDEADYFLGNRQDVRARLDRVGNLIAGFETPYGMELLASVHWIACHDPSPATDAESAAKRIAEWSDRKARMFKSDHIHMAWNRLTSQKWIPVSN